MFHQHVFVILLWGILMSPLDNLLAKCMQQVTHTIWLSDYYDAFRQKPQLFI